jgi:tetratricopeptide (TPR) repeat protein
MKFGASGFAILAVLCASGAMMAGGAAFAQLLEQHHGAELGAEPPAAAPVPPAQSGVDTTGFWFHLNHNRLSQAQTELNRLQSENPGWRPPADLIRALVQARIRAALRSGDRAEARRLLATLGKSQPCAQPDIAWGMAAPGENGAGGDPDLLLRMARTCSNSRIRAASMDRYLAQIPKSELAAKVDQLEQQPWPAAVRASLDQAWLAMETAGVAAMKLPPERLAEIETRAKRARNAGAADALGWHYLNDGRPESARSWFLNASRWSNGKNEKDGLARTYLALNDPEDALKLASGDPALKTPLADAYLNRALAAIKTGASRESVASDLQNAAAFGHTTAWEDAGWAFMDRKQPLSAVASFEQAGTGEGAIFGQVIALRAAGQIADANTLACAHADQSARTKTACADGLAAEQLAAYSAGRYDQAIQLGDRLAKIAPDRTGAAVLEAWSLLRTGHPDESAQRFQTLYESSHDPDLAEGLVESLRASGKQDILDQRADADPLLRRLAQTAAVSNAFARKQFDLAEREGGDPALQNRSDWSAGAGFETRQTGGQAGLGKLNVMAPETIVQGMIGTVRVAVRLIDSIVNTGTAAPNALIGLRPQLDTTVPLASSNTVQPVLTLLQERPEGNYFGQLSTTPLNGPVSPRPLGQIGATRYIDRFIVTGQFYSRGVTQSLLSYSGLRDPVSGAYWGRVVETGLGGQGIYLPAERVGLALTGEASMLQGKQVQDNSRAYLRADASYDVKPAGFDHLRAGPFLSWEHFNRNLSFYTLGQGGYYSPSSDRQAGVLIDALTDEGQLWQIEVKASASYDLASNAAAPQYPLLPGTGTPYASSSSHGFNTNLSLRASALLGPHVVLSGFARNATASNYNDYALGLFLTIPFGARAGVVSADLADSVFTPFR